MNESWTSDCIGNIDPKFIEEANAFPAAKPKKSYWKRVLTKWLIIFMGVSVLHCIFMILPYQAYKCVYKDGDYYIYLGPKYVLPNCKCQVHTVKNVPLFSESLDDMINDLRYGRFTEEELHSIGIEARYNDGWVRIFNIDKLYDAVLPEGLPEYYITFQPSYYIFCIDWDESDSSVKLRPFDPGSLDSKISGIAGFENTVTIEANSPDANAARSEAYWHSENNYLDEYPFNCYYIITTEDVTYYVIEGYQTDVKTDTPVNITIYAKKHSGECFSVTISNWAQRPDVQWLASFDIVPYQP